MKSKFFKSTITLLACAALVAPVITSCDKGGSSSSSTTPSASSTIPYKATKVSEIADMDAFTKIVVDRFADDIIKNQSRVTVHIDYDSLDATSLSKITIRYLAVDKIRKVVSVQSRKYYGDLDIFKIQNGLILDPLGFDFTLNINDDDIDERPKKVKLVKAACTKVGIPLDSVYFASINKQSSKEGIDTYVLNVDTDKEEVHYKLQIETAPTYDELAQNVIDNKCTFEKRAHSIDYGPISYTVPEAK